MEVAFAEGNLGSLAVRTNRPDLARPRFMAALEIKQKLLDKDPNNSKLKANVADTMSWIGSLESKAGNLSEAIKWRKHEVELKMALVRQDEDARSRYRLGVALFRLSDDMYRLGQTEEALKYARQSVSIYRNLVDYDPENAVWNRELQTNLLNQARILLSRGKMDGVALMIQEAKEGIDAALETNPSEAILLRERAVVELHKARIHMIEDRPEQARVCALDCMARLRRLIQDGRADVEIYNEFARAAYIAAEACASSRNQTECASASKVAREALSILANFEDKEIETAALRAMLLTLAGRRNEARKLMDQVLATEYRAPETLYGSVMSRTMYSDY